MRGVAVAGVGTRYPATGARGQERGFHRSARRTITGGGVPMRGGEVPTVSIAVGVPTGTGKLLTAEACTGRTRSRLS